VGNSLHSIVEQNGLVAAGGSAMRRVLKLKMKAHPEKVRRVILDGFRQDG